MLEIKAISRENGLKQEVVIISFESFFGEGYCLCMNEDGAIFHVKNEYITITDKQYLEACTKESIDIELADFMNKTDKKLDRVQCQQLTNIICELDEYRKKIEHGTLIELPCKVGDTVYWVWEEYTKGKQKLSIEEWEVEKICIEKNEWAVKGLGEELVEGVRQFFWCHSSKFGIWWFLTREEAEKRLLELQGGKRNE